MSITRVVSGCCVFALLLSVQAFGASSEIADAAMNKNKDAGKEAAAAELSMQIPHGSRPVDKDTKAVAPIKNISKMTPEERKELRESVVKDAKP